MQSAPDTRLVSFRQDDGSCLILKVNCKLTNVCISLVASSVVVAVDPTAAAAPANTLTAPSSAPSTTVARSLISSFAQTDNATLPTAPLQTQSQQKLPIIQVADESTAITTSPASDVAMTETIPCSVPEVVVLDQAIGTVVASVTDIIDGSTQSCDETVSEDTTPYHSLDAKVFFIEKITIAFSVYFKYIVSSISDIGR